MTGYEQAYRRDRRAEFRIGYFARIAPEKGLHVLADAYVRLRAERSARPACGSRRPATRRPDHRAYLTHGSAQSSTRPDLRTSLSTEAWSTVKESSRFCRASMCCRFPQHTTSPKACFCSRRWRTACRSFSLAAERSWKSSREPAADCWSNRTIRKPLPMVFTCYGRIGRWPHLSASERSTMFASTTPSRGPLRAYLKFTRAS